MVVACTVILIKFEIAIYENVLGEECTCFIYNIYLYVLQALRCIKLNFSRDKLLAFGFGSIKNLIVQECDATMLNYSCTAWLQKNPNHAFYLLCTTKAKCPCYYLNTKTLISLLS